MLEWGNTFCSLLPEVQDESRRWFDETDGLQQHLDSLVLKLQTSIEDNQGSGYACIVKGMLHIREV